MLPVEHFNIKSKYYKWYCRIIELALLRLTPITYTERHHIIPKCLGGTDDKQNIIELTAKEHYICHHLLYHAATGNAKYKMAHAWHAMCWDVRNKVNRFIPAHGYLQARLRASNAISISNKGKRVGSENGWYNHTRFHFYNIETQDSFIGTKNGLQKYDSNISFSEAYRIVKHPHAQSKGWMVWDGINIPQKPKITGKYSSSANLEKCTFYHIDHGKIYCNRHELAEFFPQYNFTSQGLCDIIKGRQSLHRGWSVLHQPATP